MLESGNFWKPYQSSEYEQLPELPFFHNTTEFIYSKIEDSFWRLKAVEEDKFYGEKKVFFFYGNPLYVSKKWEPPVILGIHIKVKNSSFCITPTDTGMIKNMKENEITRISKIPDEELFNYVNHVDLDDMIQYINNFIFDWYGDIKNYTEVKLKDSFEPHSIPIQKEHHKLLEADMESVFNEDFLKENNLDLDKRKGTVELAIGDNGNLILPFTARLAFVALPEDKRGNNFHIKKLKEYFDKNHGEIVDDSKIYPYDYLENGAHKSIKQIMDECRGEYYKRFKIN
ncbi:hypothetical protein [Pseudotenacibaculum haliotis]|uniref:Uncharacterized protein n=1 Tax=Pseudotenacibaculum haliotis TaxID=1862138 RepID=A0ABW5LWE9_9FLAO